MKPPNCHSGFLTGAPGLWKMANPVREYDWGSARALAALQGREPSGRPEAELWMGAHPAEPSRLCQPEDSEVSLAAAIHANPVAVLGRECTTRFGARLPFLLKVLAVARALSIQVHPSQARAAAGFAREQAAHTPQAERSYVDPYAKPEMLLPVTEFVALAGLRPRDRVIQMLTSLDVPALRPVLLTVKSTAGQAGPASVLAILATGSATRAGELDLPTRTRPARQDGHKPRSRRTVKPRMGHRPGRTAPRRPAGSGAIAATAAPT